MTPKRDCDVVLKGGITSGVAYGGALVALAREFRLRGIGGASAGAIAAAIAAAAEFRRQKDGRGEFSELLRRPIDELTTPGFMTGLLQPVPGAAPALRVLLALLRQRRAAWRRALAALGHVLAARWWYPGATLALAGVATWVVLRAEAPVALRVALVVLLWLSAVIPAILVPVLLTVRATRRVLSSPVHGFGLCSGRSGETLALTDWLHETIQRVAGLSPGSPLTFGDLEARGIDLAMISTDLGRAEPVRLPTAHYWYDPAELERLFPKAITDHLAALPRPHGRGGLRPLPQRDLPVAVAVRMSLSIPLLFAAVPLYREDAEGNPLRGRRSWLLDGGVTSNFPIHFFDEWLPSRPTFGLDLRPFPAGGEGGSADRVVLPDAGSPPAARWTGVTGVVSLMQQIVDAAQNWRDTAQAELPGFRDRVCQIRLRPGEGGLHLDMDSATLHGLVDAGNQAGLRLIERFDPNGFEAHRRERYRTLLRALRSRLRRLDDPFGHLRREFKRWLVRSYEIARGRTPRGPTVPEEDQLTMRIVPRT